MTHSRRDVLAGASAALALAAASSPALAKAMLATAQVPGIYRSKIGKFEVTAVADGALSLKIDLFPTADKTEAARLISTAGRDPAKLTSALNAFVINTGDKLILVDTGIGQYQGFGLDAGRLARNLAIAGYQPADFDMVFTTHLHADHVNGLHNDGTAVFTNAELVLSEPEYAFWTDTGLMSRSPDGMKPFVEAAQKAAAPYAARTRRIKDGEDIVPGITAVLAPGHTPGHTMLRISDGAAQLLIWGDIVHTASLQFPHPEWGIAFDTDPALAIATRSRVFDMAAADGLLIAGMHIDFPGTGRVRKEAQGYSYHPAFWSPVL